MTTSSCDFEKCEAIKENLKYIREKIANGETAILKDLTTGEEFELDYQLSDRQVKIILAGGLLDYTRENS